MKPVPSRDCQLCATGKNLFCRPCLELYFGTSIKNGAPTPPACCDQPLPVGPDTLPKEVYAYFEAVARRWETVGDTRCANANCQTLNPRPTELRPRRISFTCSKCGTVACYFCGNLGHLGTCVSVPGSRFPNRCPPPGTREPAYDSRRDNCRHAGWVKRLIDPTDLPFRCNSCNGTVRRWKSFWRCRGHLCGMKECPPCATRRRRQRQRGHLTAEFSRPSLSVQPTAAIKPDPLTGWDPENSLSQSPPTSAAEAMARDFPGSNLSAGQLARLNKIIERRAMIEVYRAVINRLEGRPQKTEEQDARDRYAALQIYSEWLTLEGNQDADGGTILTAWSGESDPREGRAGSQQEVNVPQDTKKDIKVPQDSQQHVKVPQDTHQEVGVT
ncbi:hypothetical protein B0I37DRAFT_56808 [Chaetomium sp. MPI-CAGE-AT-0009]|nr:hypothetical protein B0I37DRAFT_56808 [Chaetomium sp. MPI-CAGE-AT-0009]